MSTSQIKKAKRASTAALSRVLDTQRLVKMPEDHRKFILCSCLVVILRASELSSTQKNSIWNIFRINMEVLYKSTDVFDWNPVEKRAELFHRDSRFLLVAPEGGRPEIDLVAFSMFRFEIDENMEGRDEYVSYCYELQVKEAYRGLGLGRVLVEILQKIAREWRMEKIMLTVLKVNVAAMRFYHREGFVTDATSPEDDGYLILSKAVPARIAADI